MDSTTFHIYAVVSNTIFGCLSIATLLIFVFHPRQDDKTRALIATGIINSLILFGTCFIKTTIFIINSQ